MDLTTIQNDLNEFQEFINHNFSNCATVNENPEQLERALYHLSESAFELIQLCGYLAGKLNEK